MSSSRIRNRDGATRATETCCDSFWCALLVAHLHIYIGIRANGLSCAPCVRRMRREKTNEICVPFAVVRTTPCTRSLFLFHWFRLVECIHYARACHTITKHKHESAYTPETDSLYDLTSHASVCVCECTLCSRPSLPVVHPHSRDPKSILCVLSRHYGKLFISYPSYMAHNRRQFAVCCNNSLLSTLQYSNSNGQK